LHYARWRFLVGSLKSLVVGSAGAAGRFLPLLGERDTTIRIVALANDMQVTIAADRKRGAGP